MKPFNACIIAKYTLLLMLTALATSCATIFSGANQKIKIESNPASAHVFVNGQNTYRETPCKIRVKRRQRPTQYNLRNTINIEVRKEGFKNSELNVQSSFNVVSGGSILLGGFPFIVDWAAGAHLKYPKNNYLYLEPLSARDFEPKIARDAIKKHSGVTISFMSDIDYDIPKKDKIYWNRFALIIGNENYSSFQSGLGPGANVKYAGNDAKSFKRYARNVMGIPEENITLLVDATLANMKKGIAKMNLIAKNSHGDAELFFYYAGHGIPNEKTKKPYLLPVDVSGKDINLAVGLDEVFASLGEFETKKIACFLDCCFSGGARFDLPYQSRGVKIVPKKAQINGNMVVYTATSADQSAMAYNDQKHGLFTYYLLKKFKDSKGDLSYGELGEYLKNELPLQSVLINEKEQLPQVNVGLNIDKNWENWEF